MESDKERRLRGMVGFAMRAGKVIVGTDLVCRAMQNRSVKLVLLSSHASETTKKKLVNKCEFYSIPSVTVEIDTVTLGDIIGKSCAVAAIGIKDDMFAREVIKACSQQ